MNIEQIRGFTPQLIQIAKKFGIARIYIFGSVARGDTTSRSDVDFLLEMEEGVSLFGAAGFSYEAEKLLGISVDGVPVSTLDHITDQNLVLNIQKDAVLL